MISVILSHSFCVMEVYSGLFIVISRLKKLSSGVILSCDRLFVKAHSSMRFSPGNRLQKATKASDKIQMQTTKTNARSVKKGDSNMKNSMKKLAVTASIFALLLTMFVTPVQTIAATQSYSVTCTGCNGAGWFRCGGCNATGTYSYGGKWYYCNYCHGAGYFKHTTCSGTGRLTYYYNTGNSNSSSTNNIYNSSSYIYSGSSSSSSKKLCYTCSTTGNCKICHGIGTYSGMYNSGRLDCSACNKTGKCWSCNGVGYK